MNNWDNRSKEVAYLLNPAFCGRLIYTTVKQYNLTAEKGMPFPLIYLILPLILHKNTREKISSRTKFLVWIQKNPDILVNYANRAKELVEITNESLEFLLQTQVLVMDNQADLQINSKQTSISKSKFMDSEIKECITKSEHIGKWFANTGKIENIFIGLGVRP